MTTEFSPQDFIDAAKIGAVVDLDVDELVPTAQGKARLEKIRQQKIHAHALALDLAALREALGVTQVQIAQATGRGQSHISRMESAPEKIQLSTLMSYLQGLGVHASLVIERDGATFDLELV